jgi:F-type H+-transporting ATPase subunit a
MTFASVALVLSLALGQHAPAADPHAPAAASAPAAAQAVPAAPDAHAAPAAPAAGHADPGHAAPAHGDAHGKAGGHGGGHEASLPETMMHHVANGYVIEFPGVCNGGFHWNCELDMVELTGGKWKFTVGQATFDMTPSKHVVMMLIAATLLTLLLVVATRKRALVPSGVYNFVELLVEFVRGIAISNIGKKDADRFVPYLATAFFFILFMNLLGLVPFMATATANVSVTVALAAFTFVITQFAAIKSMGIGGYLAHMTGGVPKSLWWLWPIMIPVEFLGLFTKPFALTIRLFANMVAGHFVILALLGLIFAVSVWVAPVSIALALGIFMLELFVAFVQAYIFTMLSALFIGAGLVHHGHDGDHGDEHGHADDGAADHVSHAAGKAPGHG